ncbi:hypothetical protein HDU86_003264 [Geranomyces michiganensis]|nr:hypothetical protein HDU86_003264 [Geranomyces michiganensis]
MEDSTISLNDDAMEAIDAPGPDAAYDGEETRDSRDLRERDDRRGSTSRTTNGGTSGSGGAGGAGVTSPIKHEGGSSLALGASGDRSYRGRSRSRTRSRSPRRSRIYDERETRVSKFSGGPRDPSRPSNKDCRVYVGNLAYTAELQDLKDYMRSAGEIVFADILTLPGGRSKGCGIVEYATPEEAQNAIRDLNDTQLMGRSVFIREDREADVRLGSTSNVAPHGSYGSRRGGRSDGCALFIGNLPYVIGWQDLKDHFRQAGRVTRADVLEGPDRRSRGMGTVVFETPEEAANAISMFDRTEFHGRRLEVREVGINVVLFLLGRFLGVGSRGTVGGIGQGACYLTGAVLGGIADRTWEAEHYRPHLTAHTTDQHPLAAATNLAAIIVTTMATRRRLRRLATTMVAAMAGLQLMAAAAVTADATKAIKEDTMEAMVRVVKFSSSAAQKAPS